MSACARSRGGSATGRCVAIGVLLATAAAMASEFDPLERHDAARSSSGCVAVGRECCVVWHIRRPAQHVLEAAIFVLSLVIVWLGLSLDATRRKFAAPAGRWTLYAPRPCTGCPCRDRSRCPQSRTPGPPPPTLPEPTYKSVSQEVLIEMDDGVKLGATIALPVGGRRDAASGPLPGRRRHDAVQPQRPLRLLPAATSSRRAGWSGAVVDVRGTGGSGGNLEGNFFSPREARDSYNVIEYLGTQPCSTGKVGMAGGSYVGHHPVPGRRAAAAAPRRDHAGRRDQRPLPRGLHARRRPELLLRHPVHRRPGRARRRRREQRPVAAGGHAGGEGWASRPSGRSRSTTSARPNDDDFYRDRSPIYNADEIEVPTLILGGWRDGLLRGAPEMYRRLAGARASRRASTSIRARTRAAARRSPRSRAVRTSTTRARSSFEFLQKHLAGVPAPEAAARRVLRAGAGRVRDGRVVAAADGSRFRRVDGSRLRATGRSS